MATMYKNIQIKSKDVNQIIKLLVQYKINFDEETKMINDRLHSILPFLNFTDTEPIKLLVSEELNYVTLIAHNRIMSSQLARDLSKALDCSCLYVEFCDFEFYQVIIYNKGEFETILQKGNTMDYGKEKDKFSFKLCTDILGLDREQCESLLRAINTEDMIDSFLELENSFKALLSIDFDHTNKQVVEEYKSLSCKWYFI